MPDPLVAGSPAQYVLYVWGTATGETITVNPGSNSYAVSVKIGSTSKGTFGSATQPISRIVMHGLEGNDTITVAAGVTLPAWLYGDDGDDTLNAGGGPTYLFGGSGIDTLNSAAGRSILIGGPDGDTLNAQAVGAGEAILIGGTTAYDPATPIDTTNDAALLAILNEWKSTTDDYPTRVGFILGESGTDGLNGTYYLTPGTVFNDGNAVDKLSGNATAYDLFFQSLGDTLSGGRSDNHAPILV
jgi:Ca2+-binding RTX toxin-like protein